MRHSIFFLIIILLCVPHMAGAVQAFPVLEKAIPQMALVGKGSLTTLLFDVYDIALYAPKGKWQQGQPHALSIQYKLAIDGADLAERSADEMRRQDVQAQKITEWEGKLKTIFPDVKKGTTITALNKPEKETIFYRDGIEIGKIDDPQFGPAFFAIWLGKNTSEPDMRADLMGGP